MAKKERSLHELDVEALRCRELDHAWGEPADYVTARKGKRILEFRRVQVCLRTVNLPEDSQHVRTQTIPTATFVPTKSVVHCPEDYYLHGQGRTRKAEVRREMFGRGGYR